MQEGKPDAPERVWLDPLSQEAEFIGEDHYTGTDSYYVSTGDGIPDSVEYRRANLSSLKPETVERVRAHLECHTSGEHYRGSFGSCKCDTETLLRDVLAEVEEGER